MLEPINLLSTSLACFSSFQFYSFREKDWWGLVLWNTNCCFLMNKIISWISKILLNFVWLRFSCWDLKGVTGNSFFPLCERRSNTRFKFKCFQLTLFLQKQMSYSFLFMLHLICTFTLSSHPSLRRIILLIILGDFLQVWEGLGSAMYGPFVDAAVIWWTILLLEFSLKSTETQGRIFLCFLTNSDKTFSLCEKTRNAIDDFSNYSIWNKIY